MKVRMIITEERIYDIADCGEMARGLQTAALKPLFDEKEYPSDAAAVRLVYEDATIPYTVKSRDFEVIAE